MNNIAMAQAVQRKVKPKFRGQNVLKAKAITYYPINIEREYQRVARTYMILLNKTLAEYLPIIRKAIEVERNGMRKDDDNSLMNVIKDTFMNIRTEFDKKVESFGLKNKLERLANLTRKLSIREWKRVVHKTLGINIIEDYYMGEFFSQNIKLWVENNVNLISTIPQNTLSDMMDIVNDGNTNGKSLTSIGKEIQEKYSIDKRHAQFIARDQIAKLNADITKTQQEGAGVSEYIWSTSKDQRVRDSHKKLDGKRFKWSDPPVVDEQTNRRAHPGQDYNCRCIALPVFNLAGLDLPWDKSGA